MAKKNNWLRLLGYVTGLVNQELLLRNEYLVAEDRILKVRVNQRTIAVVGRRESHAGRDRQMTDALPDIARVAKPDTLLAWYRKRIAHKFDGSQRRGFCGRPRVELAVEELVVKLARENSSWG